MKIGMLWQKYYGKLNLVSVCKLPECGDEGQKLKMNIGKMTDRTDNVQLSTLSEKEPRIKWTKAIDRNKNYLWAVEEISGDPNLYITRSCCKPGYDNRNGKPNILR